MRIRKRAPPVAAAAAAEEELRLQQFSCPAVSGSLSNRGRSDSDGVHHVDGGSCRIVAPAPSMEAPAAGGLCTTDCQNVESEATRRPRPTDGTISPVSMESSSTQETCTSLQSNDGEQDHRPTPTIVFKSSTDHISSNTKGGHGSEGGEHVPGSLNIFSNLDSSVTMDADRASNSSVLFQSLVHVFDRAGKEGFTASEAVSEIVQQGLPGLEEGSKRFNVQEESWAQFRKRKRRAPVSQRELSIGPTQCKRYDGRGWQCTQKTEEGCSFCEHHQALINKRNLRLKLAKVGSGTKVSSGADYKLNGGAQLSTGIQTKIVPEMNAVAKSQKQVKPSDGVLKLQVQPQEQLKAAKARSLKSK
ncbi:unnamed protein product [Sphagnum jensenii]|uniref:Uncharacterized protein n=2 Tax=Sphagnum jensenii TaxID=128206 RepID=A0ABP0WB36_9BRYO